MRTGSSAVLLTILVVAALTAAPVAAEVAVSWGKTFVPGTIGIGSTSTLQFTITNSSEEFGADNMAFTDNLPLAVTIAAVPAVTSTCAGSVTAPAGGTTISLTGGKLGFLKTCQIRVNVTSSTVGTHTNVSGDLTSTLNESSINSGSVTADLVVAGNRPGFLKSFSPSSVSLGGKSRLTFVIDNSANSATAASLTFLDNLPAGLTVASPANRTNTCTPLFDFGKPGIFSAAPGSSVVSLTSVGGDDATVPAFSSCTLGVDVVAGSTGTLGNTAGDLTSRNLPSGQIQSSGKANAVLTVTTSPLALSKEFTDDPVPPGEPVNLEFTIRNLDRDESATGIAFTDDLSFLSGLTAVGLPQADVCGTGSSISGTTSLSFTGGSLAPEASCTFSVTLNVPGTATPGTYTNTTSTITGTVGGSPKNGSPATDVLFVQPVPRLTKEFTNDPVGAGGVVKLKFTIKNTSTTSGATDIAFTDVLDVVLVSVASGPTAGCGANKVGVTPQPEGLLLTASEIELAAGASCSFTVDLNVAKGAASGLYLNTTSEITATVGAESLEGSPASDNLEIYGAPTIVKEFTDDPAEPGDTATLEFTIEHDELAPGDATAIAFTDDLSFLSGLAAIGLPQNDICGSGSQISGTTSLSFSGGILAPGASCTFTVTLQVPGGAPSGAHENNTSDITATVLGLTVTGENATADLLVAGLTLTKEFTDDPVLAGGSATLEFSITNLSMTEAAADIFFQDLLDDVITNLAVDPTSVPTDPCGTGSEIVLTNSNKTLTFQKGTLAAEGSCTFDVIVDVPAGTATDAYVNTTTGFQAKMGGSTSFTSFPNATDDLVVSNELLVLMKEFTDDPVAPGDTVDLEFTLTNLDASNGVTGIAFTDDLSFLAGLAAVGLPQADVCGAGSQITGTTFLSLTGGSLAAGGSCTFTVTLDVPSGAAAGFYVNTTSQVTGSIGALSVFGDPAIDTLRIALIEFSKAFDGPTTATGTATLTFTIENLDPANPVSPLSFSDNLNDMIAGAVATGLPVFDVCGAGSQLAGTFFVTLTGGSLGPGATCSFPVTVSIPESATPGTHVNTTSALTSSGLPVADPASASLEIEPPPAFSKEFAPDTIAFAGTTTLTFTIDNSASSLAATSLDFTDNLPAGVVVASPSNATTDCTGGTLTAVEGSGTISYTGGEVGAGASCTISVDVTANAAGSLVNVTGDLTSSSGNSGTATDTLTVPPGADLELTKTDRFEPIVAGRFQVYTLKVENLGPETATGVVLTDPLPPGTFFVFAEPASASCTEAAGVVTCPLGSMAAGTSVTVAIHVFVDADATDPLENLATVAGDNDDDLSNNDVLESTEVLPFSGFEIFADNNGNGFPEAAVLLQDPIGALVKDLGTGFFNGFFEFFPSGWTALAYAKTPDLNSNSSEDLVVIARNQTTGQIQMRVRDGITGFQLSAVVLNSAFLPVAIDIVPDDGFGKTLVAIAARRASDGKGTVFLRNAATGANQGQVPLPPGFWPLDVASAPSFAAGPGAELAILMAKTSTSVKRVRVKEIGTSTSVSIAAVPASLSPLDMETVPDFAGTPAPELAVLGWDRSLDRARVRTTDGASGLEVANSVSFGVGVQPIGLEVVPDFDASPAPELAVLVRNAAGKAVARVRDADTNALLLIGGFGAGSKVPIEIEIGPDSFDTPAPELGVLHRDPVSGALRVDLKDAMSGVPVSSVPYP